MCWIAFIHTVVPPEEAALLWNWNMETDRYRRSFRSVGRERLRMTEPVRILDPRIPIRMSVLRVCLHTLPEAPVTVRTTVCPSAVGLERQGVLNFMNE